MQKQSKQVHKQQIFSLPPKLTPLGQIPLCTTSELESIYRGLTDTEMQIRMCSDHDSLIKQILEEEEDFIATHRQHIDQVVEVVKVDMSLL